MRILFLSCLIVAGSLSLIDAESSKSERSGRFFLPFNILRNNNNNFLEKCPLGCDNRVRGNTAVNTIQTSQIETLKILVAGLQKKCPTLATGAQRIGKFCYTVHTLGRNFNDASHDCVKRGGYLVEPTTTSSAALWASLVTSFPTEIAAIQALNPAVNRNCYIGIRRLATGQLFYAYQNNGQLIPQADAFIMNPAVNAARLTALTIVPGGASWARLIGPAGNVNTPVELRCSICQYNLH